MTVTKQLIDNVNKIKTTLNEISVYNLDVKTAIELYYELAKKVNEVINELSRFEGVVSDEVIKQNEKLIYLLGEGLKTEVVKKIDQMVTDGTIQDLINNKIFNDLNNKIDTFKQEVNEQFNTKANQSDLDAKIDKTTKFDESYFTDSFKEQLNKGVVTLNGSAGLKSISPSKTTFITNAKNLFNYATVIDGKICNYGNGNLYDSADYWTSDFIPVTVNQQYTQSHDWHVIFFNDKFVFVSGLQGDIGTNKTFTVPAGVSYCRISSKANKYLYQLEQGTTSTELEKYVEKMDNIEVSKFKNNTISINNFKGEDIYNIFNKNTVTLGYVLNNADGTNLANPNYFVSDFIPTNDYKKIVASELRTACFFDKNKKYISIGNINNDPISENCLIDVPVNAEYIKVSTQKSKLDTFMLCYGSILPNTYKKYGRVLDGLIIDKKTGYFNSNWCSYGDSTVQKGNWQNKISRYFNMLHTNCGVGGSTVTNLQDAMCSDERISSIPTNTNLITFLGGINDWCRNVPLGDCDLSNEDTSTYFGALNVMFKKITTKLPYARLVVLGTTFAKFPNRLVFDDKYGLKNNLGLMSIDYGKANIEMARLHGLPCVDLGTNCGWNDNNISIYVTNDGAYLHFNELGAKRVSEVVIGLLKSIEPVLLN